MPDLLRTPPELSAFPFSILYGGHEQVAVLLSCFMTSLLFGVSATDPITFFGVSALLSLVALLASYIPARRAMRLDPTTALRVE